jgi:bis(5'-nucleosyl)-tetraphosphatase (symmetrical)
MALREAAVVVLGNHDLHLLARADGVAEAKRRDTLDGILRAQDSDEMLDWLRTRPLLHRAPGHVMVHAGIPPLWTLRDAERRARAAEKALQGPARKTFLRAWRGARIDGAVARAARDAAALTTVRVVDSRGRPTNGFSGPPSEAPSGARPWYRARGCDPRGATIVFGHWAALGWLSEPGFLALDTGCVWGGRLTAVRLEDRRRVSVARED